jgi:hypothetical protein
MSGRSATAAVMAAQAAEARESLAAVMCDPVKVVAAIETAAGQGRTWLRLANPDKLNLDDTKAWRRLLRRLAELDYVARLDWVMPVPGEDEELKHSVLVIGWGPIGVGMRSPLELLRSKAVD